ncbi:hypothetical protein ACX0G9_04360 [Flavitalea flava]
MLRIKIFPNFFLFVLGILGLCCLGSCKKYARPGSIPAAAYIRVFDGINTPAIYQPGDTLNQLAPFPRVCFLFDPVFDASGNPMDASILGDFLGPMPDYFLPQQVRPGQKATGAFENSYNEDYPGVGTVLTAPVTKGLDLSRWAQVPSGRHRVVFVFRDATETPFPKLLLPYRRPVIVDTVLDFNVATFYSLEVLNKDADKPLTWGLVVRRELFPYASFSQDKIYLNLLNSSSDTSILPETVDAYYCKYFDSAVAGAAGSHVLTPEVFMTTIHKRFATDVAADAPYYAIDGIPRDSFVYAGGDYRPQMKRPTIIIRLYRVGENEAGNAQPLFAFTAGDVYYAPTLAGTAFNGHVEGRLIGPMEQTVTQNNRSNPYPMVNTLELKVTKDKKIQASLITVEYLLKVSETN